MVWVHERSPRGPDELTAHSAGGRPMRSLSYADLGLRTICLLETAHTNPVGVLLCHNKLLSFGAANWHNNNGFAGSARFSRLDAVFVFRSLRFRHIVDFVEQRTFFEPSSTRTSSSAY